MLVRWIFLLSIFLQYCWPRYFFVNVVGKGVSGFTLFTILSFVISLYLLISNRSNRAILAIQIRRSWYVLLAFAAFWLWRLVSDFMGITPMQSLSITALEYLYLGSWFVSGMVLFTDARLRSTFPYVILVSGIAMTIFGLLELKTGMPLSKTLGFADLQAGDVYKINTIGNTLERNGAVRIRSLFSGPLLYGQMAAALTPVALHFLFSKRTALKILGGLLFLCAVTSVQIANARSPFMIMGISAAVYFVLFFLDPRRSRSLLILFWGIIGLSLATPVVMEATLAMTSGRTAEEVISSNARDRQIDKGRASLAYRPLNGYGDGNGASIAGVIVGANGAVAVDNYYLTVAVESGYVGVFLFCAMLLAFFFRGLFSVFLSTDLVTRSGLAVAVSTIIGLALGLTILSVVDPLSVIYMMGGFIVAADATRRRVPSISDRRMPPIDRLQEAAPSRSESLLPIDDILKIDDPPV